MSIIRPIVIVAVLTMTDAVIVTILTISGVIVGIGLITQLIRVALLAPEEVIHTTVIFYQFQNARLTALSA
jgi:hypothetical protein